MISGNEAQCANGGGQVDIHNCLLLVTIEENEGSGRFIQSLKAKFRFSAINKLLPDLNLEKKNSKMPTAIINC